MAFLSRVAAVSPFGPIFGKELRTTARRKRSYLLRVGYLGLLLLVLLIAYMSVAEFGRRGGGLTARAQEQAMLGSVFFAAFSMFSVIVMGLIGPVLTSTAIGSERLARTLPVLLMTPINTWQLLGGKLFSRLLAAMTLIGLSLPVLALVQLLGGVELEQMLAVLCLCTTFVMSCAAVGLFYSALMNRAYAVILLSYVTLGVVYCLAPFLIAVGFDMNERTAFRLATYTHPVITTMVQSVPGGLTFVGNRWGWCCVNQLALTAVLVWASALVLRRSAATAGEQPAAVDPASLIPLAAPAGAAADAWAAGAGGTAVPPPVYTGPATPAPPGAVPPILPPVDPASALIDGTSPPLAAPAARVVPYAPPPSAAGPTGVDILFYWPFYLVGYLMGMGPWARRNRIRDVADNPILWRELGRSLLPRPWHRVVATSLTLGLLLLVYAVMADDNDLDDPDAQTVFAIVFAIIGWLLTAVLSATAIAGEKESDTWTVLLAAPVSGSQIVWGKVAGLNRRMLWPLVLVAAHMVLFAAAGVIHPLAVVLVLWVIITFNSIWMATGLWLSLRMKRVTFAVVTNLMLAVLAFGVPAALLFVFGVLIGDRVEKWVEQVYWYLPYYYLGEGLHNLNWTYGRRWYYGGYGDPSDSMFDLPGYGNPVTIAPFAMTVFVAGCLHLLAAGLLVARTAANFDRLVGRAGRQAHGGAFDTDDAVIAAGPGHFAPFWRRAVALVIDQLIVQVTGADHLGLIAGVVAVIGHTDDGTRFRPEEAITQYTVWGVVAAALLAWPYYAGFECSRMRATPGKSVMGIFVTDIEGRRVTFLRATARYFGRVLSGAILGIGYLLALTDREHRTLHDGIAGTRVLQR